MKFFNVLVPVFSFVLLLNSLASDIPNRPEKLKFPVIPIRASKAADYRVELKSGPVAYVVPIANCRLSIFRILVRTGQYVDTTEKFGVSELTGTLLTTGGTKNRTAEQLEERLAFLAAELDSSVGETSGNIHLNLLSKDLDEGMKILREVLTEPRFQEDRIALVKDQEMQSIRQRNDESSDIEEREKDFLAFGENFWANRYMTAATLEGITRADLEAFHQKWFVPSNFVVAVSGDFDRDQMIQKLEELFANWPFKGQKPPAIPTGTQFAKPGVYIVNKDVNQGRVSMMLPGILRDDPDYFAVAIMNNILGGGGFTSHIMERVRSDEGLAYSAGSRFPAACIIR